MYRLCFATVSVSYVSTWPVSLFVRFRRPGSDGTCTVISAEQAYLPKDEAQVEDEDGEKVAKLVEDLQENEDVIRVTTTLDSLGSGSEDE